MGKKKKKMILGVSKKTEKKGDVLLLKIRKERLKLKKSIPL